MPVLRGTWGINVDAYTKYLLTMIVAYPTDKFIHAIGMAESVTAAKRLRLAGAVSVGDGTSMSKVYEPYILWQISSTNSTG